MWSLFGLVLVTLSNIIVVPESVMPLLPENMEENSIKEPNDSKYLLHTFIDNQDNSQVIRPSPQPESKTETVNQYSPAYNNRSNKLIEHLAPQAIDRSPALEPCIDNNCASPIPKPTNIIEPTRRPRPTDIPSPSPFPGLAVKKIPEPTHEPETPLCPSIPPNSKLGPERPLVEDSYNCLD